MSEEQKATVSEEEIIAVLQMVEDPELFLDIWFLGLIYDIRIQGGEVEIDMTFTTPMCPAGPSLVGQVQAVVNALPGVEETRVHVVFDPPWQANDEVKAMLGMM
ncbi:metal-sulfur cluster assembly factor [bacterium]|nr:metal-sulfur cluster assembly factor [bacterium]